MNLKIKKRKKKLILWIIIFQKFLRNIYLFNITTTKYSIFKNREQNIKIKFIQRKEKKVLSFSFFFLLLKS